MTKEDIIRMARDCGINFHQAGWLELERFFYLAQEAEREACAKVADRHSTCANDNPNVIAAAIRARGKQ